jgi:large subunit ribosomal protein L24
MAAGGGTRAGRGAAKKATPGKAPGMKIKKGDHVIVTAGKDSGREGTVILTYPDRQRVLVQGVNMIKKNTKVDYQGRRGAKEGGIVHQEAPIHVSNVQLIDPETKKPARAGYRRDEDNKKVRVSRASGKDI